MNLYEIKENYLEFLNKIETGEIEEEFIADTLESIQDEFNTKVDNIACYIKNLKSETQAIKEEEAKLAERRKAKESKAQNLLDYVEKMMKESGMKKVETARNAVQLKLSPPSVKIADIENFVDWGVKNERWDIIRRKYEPDKSAIKNYIKHGDNIDGCSLEQTEKINLK